MLGNLISGVLDRLVPTQLHPLVDGAAAAVDFSAGDPIGGLLDSERVLTDLSSAGGPAPQDSLEPSTPPPLF